MIVNYNHYFAKLFIFQVVSPAGGLQRDASIDVEDEFHRAPESSAELQTPAETRSPERNSEGVIFPRAEETPRPMEDVKEVQRNENNLEGRLGVDPESDNENGKENGVYPMESEEEKENREAMEAWEAQRGIEGANFR